MNFGLLGHPLSHSFSKTYFSDYFKTYNLPHIYQNFDVANIEQFIEHMPSYALRGFNVTIPYKQKIIPFLNDVDPIASEIGSVNVVLIENHRLKGFNTDYIGFMHSIKPHLHSHHSKALILGTGGSSKAVQYALKCLKIPFLLVSRHPEADQISYSQIDQTLLESHPIIVQCSPIGMFPNLNECPDIPYEYLTPKHLLFDLIYNPAETLFLQKGQVQGAQTLNGLKMLEIQAQESWKIWTLNTH